jgi:hypothetical protein
MANAKVECPYCEGDGREQWGSDPDTGKPIYLDCSVCDGEGEVEA